MVSVKESLVSGTGRDIAPSAGTCFIEDSVRAKSKSMACSLDEGSVPDAITIGTLQQRS